MKLFRPSLVFLSSILLVSPVAYAGSQRGAISRASVSRAAVSRPSVSRAGGNFRSVSRSSFGTLGGQRWATTNHFSRPATFSRSNFMRSNLSNTNFSGTNRRAYNNFNRGTVGSSSTTLRNNSVLRSNNLGVNRSFDRVGNGRLANNRRWNGNGNGNGNGNWDHHHHHHHGGSSIIFIGGFGYPWYYGSSFYDYYPYGYGYGYGDYGYGYGDTYPAASYYYSGGSYDGGVYQGGDPGGYQDDQSGGTTYSDGNDSAVAEVQRVLAREGFYHGPIDGVAGSRTYYAIRAYERSHNLQADGQISRELLDAMGLR